MKHLKKTIIFLMFTLIVAISFMMMLPVVFAEDEWLFSDSAVIKLDITSELNAYATSSNYLFDSLIINFSFIPMNTNRQKVSIAYYPTPKSIGNEVIFERKMIGKTDFGYNSEITTYNNIKKVQRKINFPQDFSKNTELLPYLKPTKRINSDNPSIIKEASKLAEGEDDYFLVVDKISDFVQSEVNYNLSTLFIPGTKEASWVLENKEGVCSEISVLFIALLRAIGIPTKFVSGVAYTNSPLFEYSYGPHAWAEVYYPGVGWIPYDITYGEFGYIDLGHIEMKKLPYVSESSTTYAWKAKNVEIEAGEMKIQGNAIKQNNYIKKLIEINVHPYYDKVGFLSYNVLVVKLKNPNDFYISKRIKIANTEGLEIPVKEKQIALKPLEEKTIYFIVKTANGDKNYYYTYPVTVYTEQNETSYAEFKSSSSWFMLTENEMLNILSEIATKEGKIYNKNLAFNCFTRDYYIYENINLNCRIQNSGNTFIEGLNICVSNSCIKKDIGINRKEKLNFSVKGINLGENKIPIEIYNKEINQKDFLKINVLDIPKIEIIKTSYPENVDFDSEFEISLLINRTSVSEPNRIMSQIIIDGSKRKLEIKGLKKMFNVTAKINGNELTKQSNLEFIVTYEDSLGRKYNVRENGKISLNDLTFNQKIKVMMNNIESFFKNLFLS